MLRCVGLLLLLAPSAGRRRLSSWQQLAKLAADDPNVNERFGHSVDIAGEFVVASAENGEKVFVLGTLDGGATYWEVAQLTANDAAAGDEFGKAVAIDGGTVVVGAYGKDAQTGAVYVFRTTDDWDMYDEFKLTASDAAAGDRFGISVAIYSDPIDGDTIVVGADGADGRGAVYVFDHDGNELEKLTAPDAAPEDEFGISVAIYKKVIVVGTYFKESAYVFSGATFGQVVTLTASDGEEGDRFGRSVAIDGDKIVVGAFEDGDKGSAYFFHTSDGWGDSNPAYTETKLTATDAAEDDRFGWSVAVDGDTVVIGADGDDDNGGDHSGSAYAFRTTDDGATFDEIKITADDASAADEFGYSVAIDGGTIVIGARNARLNANTNDDQGEGAAYAFELSLAPAPQPALVSAPTPRPTLAGALAGGAESSGGGNSANNAGLGVGALVSIVVVVTLLLCAVAGTLTYRRERARRLHKEEDLEAGKGDALARQRDVSECVATGMSLVNTLLTVGSAVPFVGELCSSANELFGSANEFGDKADDVAMAARRVNEVLSMVHLIAKNIENLEDGKDLVSTKMERLVSLLTKFNAAVRKFGDKGWLKRMWTVRTHVDSLSELDKEIVAALESFRDVYRFATDSVIVQRTYRLEASISELVSQRVRKTGESEETARSILSTDPNIIQAVAVDAGVPPSELAIELSEFRLEMRESFQKVEGQLDAITPKLDEIRASALTPRFREKVVTKSFFKEQLPSPVEKKKAQREDRRLAELELELDSVAEAPFAAGGQGAVFLGESEGEPICLKKVPLIGIIQSEREKILASFRREVKIACEVRSQRCVRLLGVVTTDPTYVGLVTEYLEGGSLRAALSSDAAIEQHQRTWAADVAQGMKYLYGHGIEHRDLKSGNVLLTSGQARAKVADFGLSRCEELNTMTQTKAAVGTAAYMAPELLEDNVFDEKSDVYSYGILLWEIYDRGIPWKGLKPMQIMRKVVDKRERPPLPSTMPDDLRALVGTCWSPGPDDRPAFAEIAGHLHSPRSPPPVPPATTGQGTTKPLA